MRRLKQKEIAVHKSSSGSKPMRPIYIKATDTNGTSPTTIRTTRKSRRYQQRYHKRQFLKIKMEQALTIATEEKAFHHRSDQVSSAITNKIKQQFR